MSDANERFYFGLEDPEADAIVRAVEVSVGRVPGYPEAYYYEGEPGDRVVGVGEVVEYFPGLDLNCRGLRGYDEALAEVRRVAADEGVKLYRGGSSCEYRPASRYQTA